MPGDGLGGRAARGATPASQGPPRLGADGRGESLAGQPGGDAELALALARSILAQGQYEADRAFLTYADWLRSEPFDGGGATGAALAGKPSPDSPTNGSLLPPSPPAAHPHALPPVPTRAPPPPHLLL